MVVGETHHFRKQLVLLIFFYPVRWPAWKKNSRRRPWWWLKRRRGGGDDIMWWHQDMRTCQVIMEVHQWGMWKRETIGNYRCDGWDSYEIGFLHVYELNTFGCFMSYLCFTFWFILDHFGSLDVWMFSTWAVYSSGLFSDGPGYHWHSGCEFS